MTNENEIVIPNNIKIALSGGNLIIGDFSRVIDLNFIGTIPDGKNMFFPVYNPLMLVIFNDNGAVKISMQPLLAMGNNKLISLNYNSLDFIYEPSEEIQDLYRKTLEKIKEAEVVDKAKKQGIVTDISDFRNRNPKDIA
jgi:hypothetical protein